jgi:hypothetical protein
MLLAMAFAQIASAGCVRGKITLTEYGPSLISEKSEFIGTVENPREFPNDEEEYFEYTFDNSPGLAGDQAFVTVNQVSSCP